MKDMAFKYIQQKKIVYGLMIHDITRSNRVKLKFMEN